MLTGLSEFWLSVAYHFKQSFGINIYFEWLPMFICNGCIRFQQIGVEGMSWQTFIYDNVYINFSGYVLLVKWKFYTLTEFVLSGLHVKE